MSKQTVIRQSMPVRTLLSKGLQDVQPKLRISQPGDAFEQEADQVADDLMRIPESDQFGVQGSSTPLPLPGNIRQNEQVHRIIQRMAASKEEQEEPVQTKREGSSATVVTSGLSAGIRSLRGNGQPLSSPTRGFFENRFGADFSQVRVHTDVQSGELASSIKARAFTTGRDIFFAGGEYAPETHTGRKLLAHELTHVLQQQGSRSEIQRACTPAMFSTSTDPIFFPHQRTILAVYSGRRDLRRWTSRREAVGLIQQALVDLGYNLGPHGPRLDGVDRIFGPDTEAGIRAFQTAESITWATPGVVDQDTLQCLDEVRSKRVVPSHQTPTVTEEQYRIETERTGGRDEDIFFARGSATLDAADRSKIHRLLTRFINPLQGCPITLEGFISEDEIADFGPSLATQRVNAVNAEFASQNHDDPGRMCPLPMLPLRVLSPQPQASTGVSDYPGRRKVEVVPASARSTTSPCPPGSPQFRPLTPAESTILNNSIDTAKGWINTALGKLVAGDTGGDGALNAYFGGTGRRSTIRTNLTTWRNHMDTTKRTRNQVGTQCNSTCRTAIAFNTGTGSTAMMTLCPGYFGSLSVHPPLSQNEKKAFVLLHESGHGSIGTKDTAYGHRRLIEFLRDYPREAEKNTDSYTLMVLCLNGYSTYCNAPAATDTTPGLTTAEAKKARRGLAWLESWLTWTQQDASGVYTVMNRARLAGRSLNAINTYYGGVYDPLMVHAFDIRRPPGDPPPTLREQTTVAAILDRILTMRRATRAGLTVEKDTSATPVERWSNGPGRELYLINSYFLLGNDSAHDRDRVERLLPLIIAAHSAISPVLRLAYATYIKDDVRANWNNLP